MATTPLHYVGMPDYAGNVNQLLLRATKFTQRNLVLKYLCQFMTSVFTSRLPVMANNLITPAEVIALKLRALPTTIPGPVQDPKNKKKIIGDAVLAVVANLCLRLEVQELELYPLVISETMNFYTNNVKIILRDVMTKEIQFCFTGTQDCGTIPIEVYDPDQPPLVVPEGTVLPLPVIPAPDGEFPYIVVTTEFAATGCSCSGSYHVAFTVCDQTTKESIETDCKEPDFCLPHIVMVSDIVGQQRGPVATISCQCPETVGGCSCKPKKGCHPVPTKKCGCK